MVACHVQQLRAEQGPGVSEATGQHTISVRVVNDGARVCLLRGYPHVVLRSGTHVLPFVFTHAGDQMVTDQPPRAVAIPSGGAAWVLVNKYRCDLGDRAQATELDLDGLRLPLVRGTFGWCGRGDPGSRVAVSPYEPTEAAALRTPTCDAAQLTLRAGARRVVGGRFGQTLTFTNGWDEPCELRGWPSLSGVRTRRVLRSGTPRIVTLRPRGTASFDVSGDLRQHACPTLRALLVRLPDGDGLFRVAVRMPHCGLWRVAPLVAGR